MFKEWEDRNTNNSSGWSTDLKLEFNISNGK